ncbi:MAG: DNA metabolism protein [Proteobacteria bacterium]|nr:MAG: DNA metabolism protein [Pseudomonadota bacterium]
MTTLVYDGSFYGWLTAVFDIYEYKLKDVFFAGPGTAVNSLFSTQHQVVTDEGKANRVLKGLQQRLSAEGLRKLRRTFFSGVDRFDEVMWRFVEYAFRSEKNIEGDLTNKAVWEVKQASAKVRKESHRMEAFVRFQLTKDQLYYSVVEPDCNVLPLISRHFESRYANQRWLIYDAKRKYGIYYDLESVSTVELKFNHGSASSRFIAEISDEKEMFFQELWREYFRSVNIESRKNLKLHLQHMPKRYWKHMTEKVPDGI